MSKNENPPSQLDAKDKELIRETAYQENLYQAWFVTSLEQTKSVFTLASAGVGLSVTLIFSVNNKPPGSWAPVWLLLATVAFAATVSLCIWVFRINGRLVAKLIKDADSETEDGLVGRVDQTSRILFGAGIVFLVFACIAQIWLLG